VWSACDEANLNAVHLHGVIAGSIHGTYWHNANKHQPKRPEKDFCFFHDAKVLKSWELVVRSEDYFLRV
jgi:hypothetical protein